MELFNDFKRGDQLVILDAYARKTAPKGRNRLKINHIGTDGWVSVTYEDGTDDILMTSQIQKHWGYSAGMRTELWKVLNKC